MEKESDQVIKARERAFMTSKVDLSSLLAEEHRPGQNSLDPSTISVAGSLGPVFSTSTPSQHETLEMHPSQNALGHRNISSGVWDSSPQRTVAKTNSLVNADADVSPKIIARERQFRTSRVTSDLAESKEKQPQESRGQVWRKPIAASPKFRETTEVEDELIKARERQFRTCRIDNVSVNVRDETSLEEPEPVEGPRAASPKEWRNRQRSVSPDRGDNQAQSATRVATTLSSFLDPSVPSEPQVPMYQDSVSVWSTHSAPIISRGTHDSIDRENEGEVRRVQSTVPPACSSADTERGQRSKTRTGGLVTPGAYSVDIKGDISRTMQRQTAVEPLSNEQTTMNGGDSDDEVALTPQEIQDERTKQMERETRRVTRFGQASHQQIPGLVHGQALALVRPRASYARRINRHWDAEFGEDSGELSVSQSNLTLKQLKLDPALEPPPSDKQANGKQTKQQTRAPPSAVLRIGTKLNQAINAHHSRRPPRRKFHKDRVLGRNDEASRVESIEEASEEQPAVGAMRVFSGGVVVPTQCGSLTPQPVTVSVDSEEVSQINAVSQTSVESEPGALDPEEPIKTSETDAADPNSETENKRWFCSKIFKRVASFTFFGMAVTGLALLLTSGKDDEVAFPEFDTASPTASPRVDIARLSAATSYILRDVSTTAGLDDDTSPQYAALQWIIEHDKLSPISEKSSEDEIKVLLDRYVLAVFFFSLSGQRWLSAAGWLNGTLNHCLGWEYVSCDGADVVSINTGGSFAGIDGGTAMSGSLPSELLHLTSLRELNLQSNDISEIPAFNERMSNLRTLRLSGNPFGGDISSLRELTGLETLTLQNTAMKGTLDASIGLLTNLRVLHLHSNDLTGTVSSDFQQLAMLTDLRVARNRLKGDVNRVLSGLNNLVLVDLSYNLFTGEVGQNFSTLGNLQDVDISYNSLSGSIPTEIGEMNLKSLYLQNNFISGLIPSEIGALSSTLENLWLSSNRLSGSIPLEASQLAKLRTLYLDATFLTGTLPVEVCGFDFLREIRLPCDVECNCESICRRC